MSCGIYMIKNKTNGHMYIGFSKNIEKRIKEHFSHVNSERKGNKNKALYNAIKKYGENNFEWYIIEEYEQEQLKEKEIYWIKYYNTYEDRSHYNETPGGDLPGRNTVHLGEDHGMAKMTNEQVIFCRQEYQKGSRSRDIWNQYFQDIIPYDGFLKMWHGQTWKHIMPEVFKQNPHKGKYTAKDRDIITELYKASGLSLNQFQKTKECYVGYGTLYRMINEPNFYDGK